MNRPLLAAIAAACVSLAGVGAAFTPDTAIAQAAALDGDWRGQDSGNVVRIREVSEGIYVMAVTQNAGQSAPMLFQRTGPGEFRFAFSDGNQAVVTVEGSGRIRIRNPDGWTDLFLRTQP